MAHATSSIEQPDNSSENPFPIVGIGASAGGLAAFQDFFSGLPKDSYPGMAFILVQHLDPNHKSILVDLIRRYTSMQVFEVEDGMAVKPNHVYIIPPGYDMALMNGVLHLMEPSAPRGQRLPIDFFFRSLAQDQKERSIGIVLSGTGSDGTLGVRAIKGEGGMVMVQNIASAEYDGMPRAAIATGMVDFELPPSDMAASIIAYWGHNPGKSIPEETTGTSKSENALKKVFILLRHQTGHDFSLYKPSTVQRRIKRRMAVHQVDTIEEYAKYLQQTPEEVKALFLDLLIGVTNFFRDPEAFKVLEEQVIPKLFAGKNANTIIRVWSPGCSTGEEAYSIAILLAERQEAMKQSFKVQVFATDIDGRAIAVARAGVYPSSIAADISPERLARFFLFSPDDGTYRIHKRIRDMLVFSEQDLIKDPPFSKLDLVSCRNVMIYMNGELQKKLLPLFHFALNPGGYLFLGTSESTGDFIDLFATLDRKLKLYSRKESITGAHGMVVSRLVPPVTAIGIALPESKKRTKTSSKMALREITEQGLLKQVAPAAALVSGQGNIFYLHGRTGMYLEPAPGEAGATNIIKMAREGLRADLTTSLDKAVATRKTVISHGLRVKTNGDYTTVNLTVRPVAGGAGAAPGEQMYLVILEAAPVEAAEKAQASHPHTASKAQNPNTLKDETRVAELQLELRAKEEYLQNANEELETSNEELKSSNEEMQSVNEELQSTNEELETSKEELQSVNEELNTVNTELQTKMGDLSRLNNDMNNLLSGSGIATVFVDHALHILRFTPFATQVINLIPGDVGRPVNHITSTLVGYNSLAEDVHAVLDTLVPRKLEVQTMTGNWYEMRIQPYRTLDNVIEGAVITFVDFDEIVRTRQALRAANDLLRLAVVVRDSHDAITVQDLFGRTLAWNPGAVRMYGWTEEEALLMNARERIPEGLRKEALAKLISLGKHDLLGIYRTQRLTKEGKVIEVSMVSTALLDGAGKMYAIATTEREIVQTQKGGAA